MSGVTSHGLILLDAAITIAIGEAWDGSTPTFAAGQSYMGRVKEMRQTSTLRSTDVGGGGMLDEQNRYSKRSKRVTLRGVVLADGFALRGAVEVGHWIRVSSVPLSTMVTPVVVEGVITNYEWSASDDGPQLESVEIDCNATYTAA